MSNMSYCRFENTYKDLEDCLEHLEDGDLSKIEELYRDKLMFLCESIAENLVMKRLNN
jgi:hypothetical protein